LSSLKKGKQCTIKDIAAEAGVSLRTVSLVMNNSGRISLPTRKRVMAIAEAMNYQPNINAKSLVNNKSYLFGVNLPYVNLSFVHSIIAGMERKSIELDYELLLSSTKFSDISFLDDDIPVIEKSLERLVYRRVDGIVCLPDSRAVKSYRNVVARGTPLLQLLRKIPELPCPSILVDNEKGMYQAVKHLLDRGIKTIGFLRYHNAHYQEGNNRYKGYRRACREQGAEFDTDRLVVSCDLTFRGGYEAALKLLGKNPGLRQSLPPPIMPRWEL
jgi:LacI family transcriptional regulator